MYLQTTRRTNQGGSIAEYFQLAQNQRHPVTRKPVAKIIHNLGCSDELDREELVRLCRSIARACQLTVIDPYDEDNESGGNDAFIAKALKIERSMKLGTALAIETLWDKTGPSG
jgi:hypothetical protein